MSIGQTNPRYSLGIDMGSVSVKIVLLDEQRTIVESGYWRHQGQPIQTLLDRLSEIEKTHPPDGIRVAAITGSNIQHIAKHLGALFVNEVIAQAKAIEYLHPETRTLIEIGGQDSKLILLKQDESQNRLSIEDFAMNSACAAGTGSFLDQQATRLGVSIEDEFAQMALKSLKPPRVAGRCSVFAKSDMIHLQQQATPDFDIIAGLCYALARNFISNLGKGKKLKSPIAFQGGVAHNQGVIKAFEKLLSLEADELIIPQHCDKTGALGAVLEVLDKGKSSRYAGAESLHIFHEKQSIKRKPLQPLAFEGNPSERHYIGPSIIPPPQNRITPAYLGIDVGSISTNVVALDREGNVLAKRYLMTAGRPIEAVRQGLEEIGEEIGDRIQVLGCGTTGSGRYLTGDFVGADTIRNEITAQATAAASLDPEVDTIFEIGGQDSKYISLENGVVVDFEMNQACAAGTGSFLEEQAERLGINIKDEFGSLALSCKNPARLGERCTVFMESDVVHYQAQGAKTDELVAGLAYSIVHNYLNRVVGDRRIGKRIFLQGGTMANAGVVAAFEKIVEQPMIVPRHHDVTGAIGMALIAKQEKERNPGPSKFRGFDLSHRKYDIETFECEHCSNACEIKKVSLEGEEPLYYGSRCERYNVKKDSAEQSHIPDLFKERSKLLLQDWIGDDQILTNREGPVLGIPRFLVNFDLMPFWNTFFKALGIKTVISSPTNKKLIHRGLEFLANEPCFPIKVAHGHALDLRDREIDYLFLPSLINMDQDDPEQKKNYLCPYIQTIPYILRSALGFPENEILRPVVHFSNGPRKAGVELCSIAEPLNRKPSEIKKAVLLAYDALQSFRSALQKRGQEILQSPENARGKLVVIVGRAYNTCDPGLNLDLPKKLRALGVCPLPLDMLPSANIDIAGDFPNMYWKYGQKILKAARIIRDNPQMAAIYLTNFSCGPDSFISSFFKKSMGHKPFLQLELDEHSADAGVITRCEAYIDSLRSCGDREFGLPEEILSPSYFFGRNGEQRKKLFIPFMCNQAYILTSAFRACGVDAEILPPSDETSMTLGRRFTTGKECVPCVVTAGDMIRQLQKKDVDPDEVAFFMPSGGGPCRFGQYSALHKFVLQEYGYQQVPIFSPNQDTQFYDQLRLGKSGFSRLAWSGIIAIDLFDKLLHAYRPYESTPGSVDDVYRQCLTKVCKTIEARGDLLPVMRESAEAFRQVRPVHRNGKPVIGVVGEIYVRNHAFSNQNIIARLEALGAEVRLPGFSEWINYTNFTRLRHCREGHQLKLFFTNYLKEKVQRSDERKLSEPFLDLLPHILEPSVLEVLERGNRYLHDSFEGEAILSVGTALEFYEQGASGLVNLMPLTCMPGTITTAVFKKLREDCNNLPAISVAYDGTELPNLETHLEAFVHQARQYMEAKK